MTTNNEQTLDNCSALILRADHSLLKWGALKKKEEDAAAILLQKRGCLLALQKLQAMLCYECGDATLKQWTDDDAERLKTGGWATAPSARIQKLLLVAHPKDLDVPAWFDPALVAARVEAEESQDLPLDLLVKKVAQYVAGEYEEAKKNYTAARGATEAENGHYDKLMEGIEKDNGVKVLESRRCGEDYAKSNRGRSPSRKPQRVDLPDPIRFKDLHERPTQAAAAIVIADDTTSVEPEDTAPPTTNNKPAKADERADAPEDAKEKKTEEKPQQPPNPEPHPPKISPSVSNVGRHEVYNERGICRKCGPDAGELKITTKHGPPLCAPCTKAYFRASDRVEGKTECNSAWCLPGRRCVVCSFENNWGSLGLRPAGTKR